jgi:PAS domain-containing protein
MVDCNQQLLEMFGATREQLVGQSFECFPHHDESSAPARASCEPERAAGTPTSGT